MNNHVARRESSTARYSINLNKGEGEYEILRILIDRSSKCDSLPNNQLDFWPC